MAIALAVARWRREVRHPRPRDPPADGRGQSAEADGATNEPATVEHIKGSEVRRLTLTAKEAERLGIRTKPVLAGKIGAAELSGTEFGVGHSSGGEQSSHDPLGRPIA